MVKKVVSTNSSLSTLAEMEANLSYAADGLRKAQADFLKAEAALETAESYYTQYQLNFNAAHEDFISKSKVKPLGTF